MCVCVRVVFVLSALATAGKQALESECPHHVLGHVLAVSKDLAQILRGRRIAHVPCQEHHGEVLVQSCTMMRKTEMNLRISLNQTH